MVQPINYDCLLKSRVGLCMGLMIAASTCTHGEVRLFGGYTDHDGVAEVCINGFWADICDDVSDMATVSRTFCRQFMGEGSCMRTHSFIIFNHCTDYTMRLTSDNCNCSVFLLITTKHRKHYTL